MKIKIVLELKGKKVELSPEDARNLFNSLKTILEEPAPCVTYPWYYLSYQPWTYTTSDCSETIIIPNSDTTGEQNA